MIYSFWKFSWSLLSHNTLVQFLKQNTILLILPGTHLTSTLADSVHFFANSSWKISTLVSSQRWSLPFNEWHEKQSSSKGSGPQMIWGQASCFLQLEPVAQKLRLINGLFLTIFSCFFANYTNVIHKTEVQTVLCVVGYKWL